MTNSAHSNTIREARPTDLARVVALDIESAAQPDTQLVRAMPGELEDGVAAGDVWVAEFDGQVVGYIHLDRQRQGHLLLAGSVVSPTVRGRGIGAALMEAVLAQAERNPLPLCAVTSPHNRIMIGMLFAHGFVAHWPLPDFFGPGRHRIGYQRLPGELTGPLTWHTPEDTNVWADLFSSGYGVVAANFACARLALGVIPLRTLGLRPCRPPDYPDCPPTP